VGYILTEELPAYELVQDITVSGSAVTSVTFNSLNIGKDDDYLLVSNLINASPSAYDVSLYKNGDTTVANYYTQMLWSSSTSTIATRYGGNIFSNMVGSGTCEVFTKIKLTNSGYFTTQTNSSESVGSISQLRSFNGTSTNTLTSITSLTVQSGGTNSIAVNSNFRLYKLVAQKVADITISTATTSVDITGLSIDKNSEYMLVSDVTTGLSTTSYNRLFVNNNVTISNYYTQALQAYGTTVNSGRDNDTFISVSDYGKTLSYVNIKLTNNSNFIWQSNSFRDYGNSTFGLINHNGTSTFTATSITQLKITSSATNAIGVGSRFQLYKLK
jgi:hypothetical protein